MNPYLVSAVISTYNSEKFIKNRIENLITQTIFNKTEIIIINSGSQQNEDKIIKEYLQDYHNIKYIRTEQRETVYQAWNRGIRISTGKYITNCNTDDILSKNALEVLSEYLEENANVCLVYADQYVTDIPNMNLNDIQKRKVIKRPDFNRIKLLERCIIGSQPMWRSSLHFLDGFWFNETYEIAGDYEFELKVAQKYDIVHFQKPLGCYYLSPKKENKEYQNSKKTFDETYEIMYKYTKDYLLNLTNEEHLEIKKKLSRYISVPRFILGPYKIIFNKLFPEKELISRAFAFWFLSISSEISNDTYAAQLFCEKFMKQSFSPLIENQLAHLKEVMNNAAN